MALNLQQIRDYVRVHMDIEEDDLPDPVLDTFIREGSRRVEYSEQRWPFYEAWSTLTANPGWTLYALDGFSGNLRRLAAMTLENENLEWRSPEEIQEMSSTTTGRPRYFTEWGGMVVLWPIPDAAYEFIVRGYRAQNDWVADGAGAEPDMPEELHNTVALWALHRAYAQQEDPEMASLYRNTFDQELNEFGRRMTEMPLQRPLVMNGRGKTSWRRSRPRFDWE